MISCEFCLSAKPRELIFRRLRLKISNSFGNNYEMADHDEDDTILQSQFPRIDFDAAFNLWLTSGLHYRDFWLSSDYRNHEKFNDLLTISLIEWKYRAKQWLRENREHPDYARHKATLEAKPLGIRDSIEIPKNEVTVAIVPYESRPLVPMSEEEASQFMYGKKVVQGPDDWEWAERMKLYLKDMLECAYIEKTDSFTGKKSRKPTMSFGEARNYVASMKDVVGIQRIALGMSNDNVSTMIASANLPQVIVSFEDPTVIATQAKDADESED